jgi:Uma2 family endonuclease
MTITVLYTVEEYLNLENQALDRSEYIEGVRYPMPGVSPNHSLILSALMGLLYFQMKGRGAIHAQDVRLKIVDSDAYFYPDVAMVLGESDFERSRGYHLLNPTVIIEILSPATADFDRETKFEFYKRIPWLQEYLLIAQDRPHIEHFQRRDDGVWHDQPNHIYERREQTIALPSVECSLVVGDVYDDVSFEK